MKTQTIMVELPDKPSSGAFHSSPSGDCEYDDALKEWTKKCNKVILEAVGGKAIQKIEYGHQKIITTKDDGPKNSQNRDYADVVVRV